MIFINFLKPRFIFPGILFCLLIFKTMTESRAVIHAQITSPISGVERDEMTNSIIGFLKWYKVNINKAASFPLLSEDREGYIRVNMGACSDYLNFIKSSNYAGESYMLYWQKYFDDQAEKVKKDQIKSDVPEGFDFDFVLYTQEPELILENIEKLQYEVTQLTDLQGSVSVKLNLDRLYQYRFDMEKSKGTWKIARITRSDVN
jgi:hypothetical protein